MSEICLAITQAGRLRPHASQDAVALDPAIDLSHTLELVPLLQPLES